MRGRLSTLEVRGNWLPASGKVGSVKARPFVRDVGIGHVGRSLPLMSLLHDWVETDQPSPFPLEVPGVKRISSLDFVRPAAGEDERRRAHERRAGRSCSNLREDNIHTESRVESTLLHNKPFPHLSGVPISTRAPSCSAVAEHWFATPAVLRTRAATSRCDCATPVLRSWVYERERESGKGGKHVTGRARLRKRGALLGNEETARGC